MNPFMETLKRIGGSGIGVPIFVIMILAMMVMPVPTLALDVFFTFNITLSLVVLLATVYALRPLELAVFPTILLLATLLRLALNVASTRVVLMHGHTGPDSAGQVIKSFGEFVIGGNFTVGLVVFAILVIINFVVVTKGAGRISEVSARFTLDAMPGKQMAIDADLNAGTIDQDEARIRRSEVAREAEFYGSMDGASKFVRGDAVAGLLVLFINILGGLVVGVVQHDMAIDEALRQYTLLAVGDGLVAQIPALLLSTATAIIVTRVSQNQNMGEQIFFQLLAQPKALAVTAGVLAMMGLVPGMPNLMFLTLAALCGGLSHYLSQSKKVQPTPPLEIPPAPSTESSGDLSWEDVSAVDLIGLEVGYRLIPMVDRNQGGELMSRIKGVRKKLSQELGFLIQSVHIRDNLELSPNGYRITLKGVTVGEGEIFPERELAINPGQVFGELPGMTVKDPAFGLNAVWIEPRQREYAQTLGYTVVDASTVAATHLSHLLQRHAHELLGHDEVSRLLENLSRGAPKLVEDLVPKALPLGTVVKVLQNLLEEGIPIRDMRTIAETLAEYASRSQDSAILVMEVRIRLGRMIVQKINGISTELPIITLDPALEQILQKALQDGGRGVAGLEPGLSERLLKSLTEAARSQESRSEPAVLLTGPGIRAALAKLVKLSIEGLHVLSYHEVPEDRKVRLVATVGR